MQLYDTAIIGGGASGLFAGSLLGKKAIILEKGEKAGRKLLLTGGGKCNFTHNLEAREMLSHYTNPRFVSNAIYAFPPESIITYFQSLGIDSYTTDEGKVFPISDSASDVLYALESKCQIKTDTNVLSISKSDGIFVLETSSGKIYSRNVILSTGGKNYEHTGSDGSGYKLASMLGHTIVKPTPALAPLRIKPDLSKAEGISEEIAIRYEKKDYCGSVVITRNGLSGPLALDISYMFDREKDVTISFAKCNFEQMRKTHGKSLLKNALDLPERLTDALLGPIAGKKVAEITKKEERFISDSIERAPFKLQAMQKGAMSTHGGVSTSEIDPKTMQSKVVDGLFFTGDLIDVDAHCGGYSLSWAFSSAFLTSECIKKCR